LCRLGPFNLYTTFARSLARRGYVVAVTSYRLRGITLFNYLPLGAIISIALGAVLALATGFSFSWALHVVIPAAL